MTESETQKWLTESAGYRLREAQDSRRMVRQTIDLLADQRRRDFPCDYRPNYERDLWESLRTHDWLVASRQAEYREALTRAGLASTG